MKEIALYISFLSLLLSLSLPSNVRPQVGYDRPQARLNPLPPNYVLPEGYHPPDTYAPPQTANFNCTGLPNGYYLLGECMNSFVGCNGGMHFHLQCPPGLVAYHVPDIICDYPREDCQKLPDNESASNASTTTQEAYNSTTESSNSTDSTTSSPTNSSSTDYEESYSNPSSSNSTENSTSTTDGETDAPSSTARSFSPEQRNAIREKLKRRLMKNYDPEKRAHRKRRMAENEDGDGNANSRSCYDTNDGKHLCNTETKTTHDTDKGKETKHTTTETKHNPDGTLHSHSQTTLKQVHGNTGTFRTQSEHVEKVVFQRALEETRKRRSPQFVIYPIGKREAWPEMPDMPKMPDMPNFPNMPNMPDMSRPHWTNNDLGQGSSTHTISRNYSSSSSSGAHSYTEHTQTTTVHRVTLGNVQDRMRRQAIEDDRHLTCASLDDGIKLSDGCQQYYKLCIGGKPTIHFCPMRLRFSEKDQSCMQEWTVPECYGTIAWDRSRPAGSSICDGDNAVPQCRATDLSLKADPTVPGRECVNKSDGAYVGEGCSSRYFVCYSEATYPIACPGKLKFSQEEDRCMEESEVNECQGQAKSTSATSQAETTSPSRTIQSSTRTYVRTSSTTAETTASTQPFSTTAEPSTSNQPSSPTVETTTPTPSTTEENDASSTTETATSTATTPSTTEVKTTTASTPTTPSPPESTTDSCFDMPDGEHVGVGCQNHYYECINDEAYLAFCPDRSHRFSQALQKCDVESVVPECN